DYGGQFFNPTVRLGVTGLSRAGKTVFITALIHGLSRGGRFPVFESFATGRIARAHLEPQPDDAVPRFDYESHVRTLIEERRWPRGRTGNANGGEIVHRLFGRLPRRTLCHELVAAGPLPDAGQSRGLAGLDLCAARGGP